MFSLLGIGPSTPKRSSTLRPTPLTSQTHNDHDTQWEHVRSGSLSSPDADDEAAFEPLGYSQVDGSDHLRGVPAQVSHLRWQEERDQLREQLEVSLAAQRNAESDRDRWERKVMELRSSLQAERQKDGSSAKSRRERELERVKEREPSLVVAATDALKEESEGLKTLLEQRVQELNTAQEGRKQEYSQLQADTERLKRELDAARVAHKDETEAVKASLQEHVQRVEYLSMDRDRVRKDRESIRGQLIAEIERLRSTHAKELEQVKTGLDEVNRDRTQAHTELRRVRKSLDAYAPQLDESLREIDDLRRQLSTTKESHRAAADLKQRLEIQGKELQKRTRGILGIKKGVRSTYDPSFLTTADAFSGAEVTSTLQRLNAEVLQSTAFMAESMVEQFFHKTDPRASKSDEQLAACKRASAAIGGIVVHFLGTKNHMDDPILIQIAFQAYLTYHLRWIACAWMVGGDENHNRFIDAIYQSVQERGSEAQAIAGRWRALTRAHVPSTPFDDSQIAFQIATKIISGLSDILLTTGCPTPKSDLISGFSSKFSEKLSFLVALAMRVNKIVREEVTSGDFEVLAIPPGTAFDVATMDDSYANGEPAKVAAKHVQSPLCDRSGSKEEDADRNYWGEAVGDEVVAQAQGCTRIGN
ncbi:hypothetical protein JVU11DRAFT_11675 [Chiua virens]|nr:hypothetical protein JVU11DRAFT_11675 [Chiua virens]